MPPKFHSWSGKYAYGATAVLCVALLLLTGFTAAVHFHADALTPSDHPCSVCVHVHAGMVQVEARLTAPVFVPSTLIEFPANTLNSQLLVSSHYIRPPPTV
jgi:hypothetical protein